MIREYKLQAKSLLRKNLNKFFLPVLFLLFMQLIGYVFLNFIVDYKMMVFGAKSDCVLIVLYFIIAVLGLSCATGLIWKQCIMVVGNVPKEELNHFKMGSIILVNVIPCALSCGYDIFDALNTYIFKILYDSSIFTIILLLLLILRCYLFYKLITSNYTFLTEKITPIQAIKKSFSIMRHQCFYYFKLELSFIVWDIIIITVHILIFFLLRSFAINTLYLGAFLIFGYGINFYLIPYKFLTYTLAIKEKTVKDS